MSFRHTTKITHEIFSSEKHSTSEDSEYSVNSEDFDSVPVLRIGKKIKKFLYSNSFITQQKRIHEQIFAFHAVTYILCRKIIKIV